MIGKGLPSQSHRRTSRRHSMRSTSSTAVDQQLGRRGFASSLVMVTLLAIAASWVVQGSSASMSTGPVQRSFNIFQAASEDTGGDSSDAISKALSLAGTSTPQVSDINSTARATSIAYRAAIATPPPSSSASPSAASSAEPTSAASAKEEEDTWSWAVGALGCASGTASGSQGLCYATGEATDAASSSLSSPTASATPGRRAVVARSVNDEDEHGFEYVRRQSVDPNDNKSGNGSPPTDISNKDSPNIGWLDTVIGAVPYKNGDLAASIVWIIATLMLVPLFLIRLLRRSSLIAHVLLTIFIWGSAVIAAFGIRAWLSMNTPTTTLVLAENVILAILPPLLLEPLLNLLAMYAAQGNARSGVPSVCLLLRFVNLVALILFAVTAAYTGVFMRQWDKALLSPVDIAAREDFPAYLPPNITRLGPIIGAFMMLVSIAGGLLLVPIARGENGSMRPGGFLGVLFVLIAISVVYRILQTLHAQSQLINESGGDSSSFPDVFLNNGDSSVSFGTLLDIDDKTIVPISAIAPPGMYSPDETGIAWSQLQQTLSSRGVPQTPVIFNLVYIFPMWLEVFLLFFVHAPGGSDGAKLQPAAIQPAA